MDQKVEQVLPTDERGTYVASLTCPHTQVTSLPCVLSGRGSGGCQANIVTNIACPDTTHTHTHTLTHTHTHTHTHAHARMHTHTQVIQCCDTRWNSSVEGAVPTRTIGISLSWPPRSAHMPSRDGGLGVGMVVCEISNCTIILLGHKPSWL